MEKLKIFISGTQDDMKPERDAVDRAVNSTTLAAGIRAETAVSQAQSPFCDVYKAILPEAVRLEGLRLLQNYSASKS